MKAILEFNLPEEDLEHKAAVNGGLYKSCLFELDQWLRSKLKYSELSDEAYKAFDETRTQLRELYNESTQDEL